MKVYKVISEKIKNKLEKSSTYTSLKPVGPWNLRLRGSQQGVVDHLLGSLITFRAWLVATAELAKLHKVCFVKYSVWK